MMLLTGADLTLYNTAIIKQRIDNLERGCCDVGIHGDFNLTEYRAHMI